MVDATKLRGPAEMPRVGTRRANLLIHRLLRPLIVKLQNVLIEEERSANRIAEF